MKQANLKTLVGVTHTHTPDCRSKGIKTEVKFVEKKIKTKKHIK